MPCSVKSQHWEQGSEAPDKAVTHHLMQAQKTIAPPNVIPESAGLDVTGVQRGLQPYRRSQSSIWCNRPLHQGETL